MEKPEKYRKNPWTKYVSYVVAAVVIFSMLFSILLPLIMMFGS